MRRDSLRDRRGAAVIYEQVLAADSGNVEALEFRGSHLYESGDFEGAVGTFTELESLDLERDLEDFDVQMETALYYFRFGEALAQLGRTDEAIGRYEEALGLNQSHLPSLEAVAPLYVASEEWPKASKSLKQILQLTGGQGEPARLARVYANLGIVEHRQGSAEKAARRFDKALELAPNDVTALLGYAEILLARKDWPNLLNAYNNIIYHAQDRDEFIHAYLMKGFVLDTQMSLADKAAQHYEKCLTFDPAQPVALLRLSELALRQDDWERATSLVARALGATADPIEPGILAHLHLAEAAARSTAGDVEAMERALETAKGRDEDLDTALGETKGDAGALRTLLQERLKGGL
jgi:tetratricopeptide (TPR) repeat protein